MALKKKTKIISILAIILLVIIGFYIKSKKSVRTPANIHTVELKDLTLSYNLNGLVESQKEVSVFSDTLSQVDKVNYRVGDAVKKGDVLLTLKENSIVENRLNYQKLALQVEKNKREYNSTFKLYNAGGASKSELDNAKVALETSIIDMNIAKKSVADFKSAIISPISGVILEQNADENYKVDQSKPLFTIADTENLQISIYVANIKAKKLAEGQKVTITSDSLNDSEVLQGTIKSIAKISTKNGNFSEPATKVIISLENYSTLKPGNSANINVIYKELKNKIIVPFNFILTDTANNKSYVFILNKNNIIEKRYVKLGENDTLNFEILEGLKANEKIVENTDNRYKEGEKIK